MRFLKFGIITVVVAAIILLIVLFRPTRREATFFPMGGIPFKVVAYGRTMLAFDKDMIAVKKRVAELEALFDRLSDVSELNRLNHDAAVAPFRMSAEMGRIMALSRKWYRDSDGAFDPSIGPLVDLWKSAAKLGHLPSEHVISSARNRVGLDKISQVGADAIFFSRDGMGLDFGAIAKGLIDDEAAKVLQSRRVARGVVDAGGNALAFGEGRFSFGIQDPTASRRGQLMAKVDVPAGAVITSGNYERYVEINGERYSHIIDPRTGRPAENGLISATVIGGNGADADALATAIMVLGREKGIELLKRLGNFEAVLVEKTPQGFEAWISSSLDGKIVFTPPWADKVHSM